MKKLPLFLILFTPLSLLQAQGVFTNKTTSALQKVIEDYPNRFKNIKGERLKEHAQAVDYKSRIEIDGAAPSLITQSGTKAGEQYSWNCLLMQTTDFEQAKSSFRDLYNQIRNTIIKIEGEKPFILNGSFEAPKEDIKNTTIRFEFLPAPEAVRSLKVELSLQFTTEWKIILSVYDQDANYYVTNAAR